MNKVLTFFFIFIFLQKVDTIQVDNNTSSQPDKTAETTEPPQPIYTSLVVRIEYTLEDPRNGVVFVQKDDEIAPYVSLGWLFNRMMINLIFFIALKSCIYCKSTFTRSNKSMVTMY
jgi:hypothetical protein